MVGEAVACGVREALGNNYSGGEAIGIFIVWACRNVKRRKRKYTPTGGQWRTIAHDYIYTAGCRCAGGARYTLVAQLQTTMVNSCCVVGCQSRVGKPGVRLFRFSLGNKEKCDKWTVAVKPGAHNGNLRSVQL